MLRPTNRGPSVGKVPADCGTVFFAAIEPAIASTGMITKNRPIIMSMPPVPEPAIAAPTPAS